MTIKNELKMREIQSLAQEAFLNVWRTQDRLMADFAQLYKEHELSVAQYNALRILRGAGAVGLSCQGVAERMVARVPDITRLLDRLEVRGLVSRERDREDRRVVVVHATKSALRLLGQLDEPVLNTHKKQFRNLTRSELRQLNRLLVKARAQGGSRDEEDPR